MALQSHADLLLNARLPVSSVFDLTLQCSICIYQYLFLNISTICFLVFLFFDFPEDFC